MPVVDQFTYRDHTVRMIWQIQESEPDLLDQLDGHYNSEELEKIHYEGRRLEWLAGRLCIKTICEHMGIPFFGVEKNEIGKPKFIKNTRYFLSISHKDDLAVGVVSATPSIGIDIEKPSDKLLRICPRVLSDIEYNSVLENPKRATRYWSAKEAVYKAFGHKGIGFKESILIEGIDNNPAFGVLKEGGKDHCFVIHFHKFRTYELAVVY